MILDARFDSQTFPALVATLLPSGGEIALLMHAYMDESGTHDGANIMAMAGYLLSDEQAKKFSHDWGMHLKATGIPFAHMTDLANGNLHYRTMPMDLRIEQGRALISLIKKRTRFGFAVAIDKSFYDAQIGQIEGLPTAYSFCVMSCMMQIRAWLQKNKAATKVAYMFESGHCHATEASRVMHNIAVNPNTKLAYRYSSHAFMEKADALPLQAADMLAWQVHHFHERCSNGNCEPRKDYRALIRPIDSCYLHSADDLRKFRKRAIADGLIAG